MFKHIKIAIKLFNIEELTLKQKINSLHYNIWHYWWGFSRLRDWYYDLKNLLFCRYDLVRTGLPKSKYADPDTRLLYSMMNIIVCMVEGEECFEVVDFYNNGRASAEAGDAIKEIYAWWKNYPNREKEKSIALDNWSRSTFINDESLMKQLANKQDTPQAQRYSKLHDELETKLHREEQEMMEKIVKYRDFLWT